MLLTALNAPPFRELLLGHTIPARIVYPNVRAHPVGRGPTDARTWCPTPAFPSVLRRAASRFAGSKRWGRVHGTGSVSE